MLACCFGVACHCLALCWRLLTFRHAFLCRVSALAFYSAMSCQCSSLRLHSCWIPCSWLRRDCGARVRAWLCFRVPVSRCIQSRSCVSKLRFGFFVAAINACMLYCVLPLLLFLFVARTFHFSFRFFLRGFAPAPVLFCPSPFSAVRPFACGSVRYAVLCDGVPCGIQLAAFASRPNKTCWSAFCLRAGFVAARACPSAALCPPVCFLYALWCVCLCFPLVLVLRALLPAQPSLRAISPNHCPVPVLPACLVFCFPNQCCLLHVPLPCPFFRFARVPVLFLALRVSVKSAFPVGFCFLPCCPVPFRALLVWLCPSGACVPRPAPSTTPVS
ncbi:hypothetical protein, conserved in T. vivax, partial [Trypanosoma vivax Y486]